MDNEKETYSKVLVTTPKGWNLQYDKVFDGDKGYKDNPNAPEFKRKGTFAGNCTDYQGVHTIALRSHYNGSGKTAFGGAKQWPAITSEVAFNEDEYQLAAKFRG